MIFFNRNLYSNYLKTDTQIVVRSILTLLIVFSLFNCGGRPDEFEQDPNGPGRNRNPGDDGSSGRGSLTECEGTSYTIYTPGDCQSVKDVGSGQPSVVDTISTHSVDILFIMDSSKAMSSFLRRENIENKFMSFLPEIQALDWRIIVTNTRYSKPKGLVGIFRKDGLNGGALSLQNREVIMDRKYLDSTVADYEEVFLDTISKEKGDGCQLPPGCSGRNEQPLKALRSSFLLNQDWTRRDADFVAVIVSSTDESKMEGTTAAELVDSVVMEFEEVYGEEKRLFVFSIIVEPEDTSCQDLQRSQQGFFKEAKFGTIITEMAKKIGGGNFSICSKDFSVVSKAIVRVTSE